MNPNARRAGGTVSDVSNTKVCGCAASVSVVPVLQSPLSIYIYVCRIKFKLCWTQQKCGYTLTTFELDLVCIPNEGRRMGTFGMLVSGNMPGTIPICLLAVLAASRKDHCPTHESNRCARSNHRKRPYENIGFGAMDVARSYVYVLVTSMATNLMIS